MQITTTLYVTNRTQWRSWLAKHHQSAKEIWLIYYKKQSGKSRIPYDDAVEEALCYGWIDSTTKAIDEECYAQRFSPRRKNSFLSELNKERVRRLIKRNKMTRFGMAIIRHHFEKQSGVQTLKKFVFPKDILRAIQAQPEAWKNFKKFPQHYQHIRIGWIDASRNRPEAFKQRLRYFIKMTAQNKKFGSIQ